jgi:hypothetical protein
MNTIRKSVITAGDIENMLQLGMINRKTELVICTRFAPVPVESVTAGHSANFNSGRNVLYMEAPVEKYLESWGNGHHGAPLRGESMAAIVSTGLADQIEEAHKEHGQA